MLHQSFPIDTCWTKKMVMVDMLKIFRVDNKKITCKASIDQQDIEEF